MAFNQRNAGVHSSTAGDGLATRSACMPPQVPAALFQTLAKMVAGQTWGERALRSAAAVSALAAITSGRRTGTWGTLRKGAILCASQVTRGQENSEFLFLNVCSGISHKPLGLGTKSVPGLAASLMGTGQSERPGGANCSLSTNAEKGSQAPKLLSGARGRQGRVCGQHEPGALFGGRGDALSLDGEGQPVS